MSAQQPTEEQVLMSNTVFARIASRIASRAGTWAADTLDTPHEMHALPVDAYVVKGFVREMELMLDQMRRKIVEVTDA